VVQLPDRFPEVIMRDILIVEDGLHERERLSQVFSGAGFSVSTAESVQEAESLLTIESFRLAVLDIGLGDKSGSYLFEVMKRSSKVPYIIILTGNPSTHLKQRFLDEGAVAYIVKASNAAGNEALLDLVRSILGNADATMQSGMPLADFLRLYVDESSRELFLDKDHQLPACVHCNSTDFLVTFNHKTQLPPVVEGKVICAHCLKDLDPVVG
jgi:DNA-binding response OmpR family regulator